MNKPNELGLNGRCSCDKSLGKKNIALWIAALPFTALSLFPWEHLQTSYHLIGLRIGQVHLSLAGWRQGIQRCLLAIARRRLRDRRNGWKGQMSERDRDESLSTRVQALNSVRCHDTFYSSCFIRRHTTHPPHNTHPQYVHSSIWLALLWMRHGKAECEQAEKGRMNVTERGKRRERERERRWEMFYHLSSWLAQRQAGKHNPDIL